MQKTYLVLVVTSGEKTVFTEKGLKIAQKDKVMKKQIEVIGECNEFGELLETFKQGNFLSNENK